MYPLLGLTIMGYVSLPSILLFICVLAASANIIISPECQSSCGGVEIPYPFGVGEGCYIDKTFEILCKNTSTTNKSRSSTPFLGVTGYEVRYIVPNFTELSVWVSTNNTRLQGGGRTNHIFDFLNQTPFTLSHLNNKLYGVGCDMVARITDLKSDNKFMSECVSLCQGYNTNFSFDHCNRGSGCCQSRITVGIKSFNLTIDWINSSSNASSYVMVQQDTDYLDDDDLVFEKENYTSISLKWSIGKQTCEEAKMNSTTYACKDKNSYCINSASGGGYYCTCSRGYEGNPYLPNNCQDFNECYGYSSDIEKKMSYFKSASPGSLCLHDDRCVNKPGSFSCSCPSGMTGDGKQNGSGCTRTLQYTLIGVAVGAALLVIAVMGFYIYRKLKKRRVIKLKQRFFKQNGGLLLEQQISSGEGNIQKTKILLLEELEKATDNFNVSRILGKGGSGTVYKGMLLDGRITAVKKAQVIDASQIGQFINELVILSHINHRHIVQLFGCCLETEVPLLAYEFISNGTLSHHLHDEECKSSLSWDNRLRIAIEIAGALCYMHSSATTPIFHRDIKSSNILLDENLKVKISDFGISRSVACENTHLTTLVQGTFGYLDPEYFHSGQFTEKSDVYSFGMVLVELLTGQEPISSNRPEEEKNLAMYFISSVKRDCVFNILETRVLNEANKEELLVVVKLAKRCLKLVGKKRPTMREVTIELERLRRVQEKKSISENEQTTNHDDTEYWLYGSSSMSTCDPESKETTMTCEDATGKAGMFPTT